MAEDQLNPSTLIGGVPVLLNGVEIEVGDIAYLGQIAGLAQDYTFADLFRLAPVAGLTPVKGIIPAGFVQSTNIAMLPGTVRPSGNGDGSIVVQRFRAVVGSRTTLSAGLMRQYWQDIRTGLFVPPTNAADRQSIQIAANASGNPRWDLIYAQMTIDVPSNSVQRRLKNPSQGNQSVQAVFQVLRQTVTIQMLQGTAAGSPTVPALPADSPSTNVWNIPLAAVRVPNGFTATSTIATADVWDKSLPMQMATPSGVTTVRPANGNNDGAGTYATNFGWGATAGVRPPIFLPPGWMGGDQLIIEIDYSNPASPSHPNNGIVDSSVDWRDRLFFMLVQGGVTTGGAGGAQHFATEATTGFASDGLPTQNASWTTVLGANSTHFNVTGPTVKTLYAANASNSGGVLTGSMTLGIGVDMSAGNLVCQSTNSPVARLFIWLMANSSFPNF